ncbi:hypothetical protein B0H67DRAFT_682897 [Lasiosphaeris hirsuta]|uniref:Uncharacterized protein n=1 Tax=Lasiosphaeris hirsuta TaxID=260670 RepID=A0AA40E164_9PEZI|nr:hypothetical protein B0H67DRAFT_682897 [Lasiosphaeris hirsuta]
MQFTRAIKLARRRIVRWRTAPSYLFKRGPRSIQLAQPLSPAPPSNTFLGLPLAIRQRIYAHFVSSLSTTATLLAIQSDSIPSLARAAAALLATCRQTYHELHSLLASQHLFTVQVHLQHCKTHQHYRPSRFPKRDVAHEFKYHSYTQDLDRDGSPIIHGDSDINTPSIHDTRTTECTPCGHISSIQRLLLPCCLCTDTTYPSGPAGIPIHGLYQGEWLDFRGLHLNPSEIFMQLCTCEFAPLPRHIAATGRSPNYHKIGELGSYLARLAKWMLSLRRIVVYYCRGFEAEKKRMSLRHMEEAARRLGVGGFFASVVGELSGRMPRDERQEVNYPAEITERVTLIGMCDPLSRAEVSGRLVHWLTEEQRSVDGMGMEGERPRAGYYGRVREGESDNGDDVRLEFYDSHPVSGKACVFDSKNKTGPLSY